MANACSHIFRDKRFVNQFVFNWPVAPWIDPNLPLDGKPRRHMQYGQTYICQYALYTRPAADAQDARRLKDALRDLLGFCRRRMATGSIPPQGARAMKLLAELGDEEYAKLYQQGKTAIDAAAKGE